MADKPLRRDPFALYCDEPTLTQQHFKEESDINVIVERAMRAGGLAPADKQAMFGDFTKIPSFRDSFDVVNKAQNAFMTLPWQLRERFGNDPQRLLSFLQDVGNREEAVRLGLLEPPKAATSDSGTTPEPTPVKGKGKGGVEPAQ